MLGTIQGLSLAVACFAGGHFALSSLGVRRRLVHIFGEGPFRAIYSVVALVSLIWAILAYKSAPFHPLWDAERQLAAIPGILMFFACILVVAGITTRNVTSVGGEAMAKEPDPVSGIVTITRHPFLWGVALWSVSHIVVNGDLASIIFFGGFALLALGGMAHIDYRRGVSMGPDWGPIAMTTSAIPFLAALQGRHAIDWAGIGWRRAVGGAALYAVLLIVHPWIAGVSILGQYLTGTPQ